MPRIVGLIVLGLCLGLCLGMASVWAQLEQTPQQLKQQLELVKAGRDFSERIAAQVVAGLEEQLAQAKTALAACPKAKVPEKGEEGTP